MAQKIKREFIEWGLFLFVGGIVYFTGWHTEVLGKMQQVVLSTGIISPEYMLEKKAGSYDFWLEDLEGKRISFEKYKEKVIFINFWASWCSPCIAEMPDIHRLYNKRKEDVSFVLISLDKDKQKARDYIARKGYTFPVYFLASPLPKIYDVRAIPTTYVLDRDGEIRVEKKGMAKYDTKKFNEMLTTLLE